MDKKPDKTVKKVLKLLNPKYGQTRTEKVKEVVDDWLKFKEDQYKDDGELILTMKEINQRHKDLKMTKDEWFAVWMLGNIKKRKRIDKFEYQSLRNVVKVGGNDVLEKFEVKFKEMIVEGHRKSVPSVMYTEDVHDKLPETYFTKSELEEIKIMYIGTESEAWKRYQRQGPFRRRSLD